MKKRLWYSDFKLLLREEMIDQAQGDENLQDKVSRDDDEMSCGDEEYVYCFIEEKSC